MIAIYSIIILLYFYRPTTHTLIVALVFIIFVSKVGASSLLHKITIDREEGIVKLRYTFFTEKVKIKDVVSWGIRAYSGKAGICSYWIVFKLVSNRKVYYPVSFTELTASGVKKYIAVFEKELLMKRVGLKPINMRGRLTGGPPVIYWVL